MSVHLLPAIAELPVDGRQSETAQAIARGTARLLRSLGFSCVSELALPSGRRADLVALNERGEIWIVEIKSSLNDLRAGADVRDTVLRCYAEMMRVLHEARGVQRGTGMTAREFELQLKSAGLGDEHIQLLDQAAQVAFATHECGAERSRDVLKLPDATAVEQQ